MSKEQKGGGRGPQPADDKRPAKQTDETAGGTIKGPQQSGNRTAERWDISRGAEPATGDSARRR